MTKLEKKLIELGYEIDKVVYISGKVGYKSYIKHQKDCDIEVRIYPNFITRKFDMKKKFTAHIEIDFKGFAKQEFIDNLQLAFNEMQKDLEILKECEEK